jgi:starch synthase
MGGHLAKLLHNVPHVMTSHSLEPRRPWKAEQLGGGYQISSWAEQTAIEAADAVIAVSAGMRADVLAAYPAVDPDRVHVVHNGIDTSLFTPTPDEAMLRGLGLDPGRPVVTYVGRITRQKGLPHLLRAMRAVRRQAQLVLCASAPDTPQIAAEVEAEVNALVGAGFDVLWLRDPLPRNDLVRLLSSSTVFVCPSVYEPLGIVNLEAMACGIPVVASDVGGIPEVVVGGETGVLVPYAAADATAYEAGLATAIDSVLDDPGRARDMGSAGRARAEANFSWTTIAEQTVAIYAAVTALT